ncbi:hypothetical protein GIB67_032636, partial [Kingdonia uniflora]
YKQTYPLPTTHYLLPTTYYHELQNRRMTYAIDAFTQHFIIRRCDQFVTEFLGLTDPQADLVFTPDECTKGTLRTELEPSASGLQLVIIILPTGPSQYGMIKRVGERSFLNIVGGRNTYLKNMRVHNQISDKQTIIFGADVSHPQPGEGSSPSIAAVVTSLDRPEVTKYQALVATQAHRQEIISDLLSMTVQHLTEFYKANGHQKPSRIIFYRRGSIQSGSALRGGCHLQDKCRRFGLSDIFFSFLLFGISRSIHYHVLCDENKFTSDELQSLTNGLCYTYARCTRSVSIVPPAYYAHLAAFRARYYIEDNSGVTLRAGSQGAASQGAETPAPLQDLTLPESVKNVMFYC